MSNTTGEINPYKLNFWQRVYLVIKSIADFFAALVGVIILIPVFIIVAIAIKVDSKGPVFFKQKRIGRGGKEFYCIKFRSMSEAAKHDVAGYEYSEVSSYITKVGAFIRKYSIDELPQLFNILTFKMSFVGYRPSQPCEHELNDAREQYSMYQIKPGISGWAQVNGRDVLAANPTKKASFDAYYLEHFSPLLDIKIFFMTIVKVFKSDDVAEGVLDPAAAVECSETKNSQDEAVNEILDTPVRDGEDEIIASDIPIEEKEVIHS